MKIEELHQQFTDYGKNAKEWMRKCILLLPEIAKHEVWRKKGFSCIYEYAAKLAGMTRGQVDDALYILRKIEDKPMLKQVVEKKGINAVRPVISIATAENEGFWANKVKEMGHHTLRAYVKEFRGAPKNGNATKIISMQLSAKLQNELQKIKGDKDWEEVMRKFIDLYNKNLEIELAQDKPNSVKNTPRAIPQRIKNYVLKRSDGQCEFPNCYKKHEHLHHTNRFSSDKTHDPDQVIALCRIHHDLAHHGLINNENQPPQTWQIRKDPDLTSLNRYVDEQLQFYRRAG